jgi:hypothetical protein
MAEGATWIPYEEWEAQVPEEIRQDPLWQMEAYRLALYLYDLAWEDCQQLMRDPRGRAIAEQLIRSAGSICANIEEGYGRGMGRQYAQFWAILWVLLGRPAAGITVVADSWLQRPLPTGTAFSPKSPAFSQLLTVSKKANPQSAINQQSAISNQQSAISNRRNSYDRDPH